MGSGTDGTISRRHVLSAAGAGAASVLAAPALAQDSPTIEWKMTTIWPSVVPGPAKLAKRIAERISLMSGGRMRVRFIEAGELVPPGEVFDAVGSGTVQMAHSASFFWDRQIPEAAFFSAIPFGLTPIEHLAWIEQGGGQELWDDLYQSFGIKPFMGGNSGIQLGGWFRKEVLSLNDLKGLKMRMPGLGGEVFQRLGAQQVSVPFNDIKSALEHGLLDAVDYLDPWSDISAGFHEIAPYYYAPGFFEPNGSGEILVSLLALDGLPEDLKAIVSCAIATENGLSLAESNWMNAGALSQLQNEYGVRIRLFPPEILEAARDASWHVLRRFKDRGGISERIYLSYFEAVNRLAPWNDVSQSSFLNARAGKG
ncbi:MAG: TRAP transporter substrate-binding protein [Stappiaceae bacterium]